MTVDARQLTLAEHFVDIGQPMRALEVLGSADSEMLESADFWRLRARAHHMLEQWDKTMEVALQGLSRNPDSIPLLYLAADAEAEMDKLAEAERTILAALAIDPEHPSLLCAYARIVARGGQLDKAERLVDEANRVDPQGPEVLRTRALLALLRGHDREAVRYSEELLRVDPDDPAAHRLRGAAQLQRGQVQAGRRSLETAVRDEPGDFALAHSVRQARIATHPLLWPVLPIVRLGAAGSWLAAIAIIFGLRLLGYDQASSIAGFVWLGIVVYSWVAVPVVTRRLERQQGS
jgi:tetratricopeptide (TPR) repeat protein